MKIIDGLMVKIFADGADRRNMMEMYSKSYIKGLTTNPTLMRQAGIKNYREFGKDILKYIKDKPISFEVFSDDFVDMERQALELASWGENVYVKIPVTNTHGVNTYRLIERLGSQQIKLNVTAVMTLDQVRGVTSALNPNIPNYLSIFAGRIADTGRDPVPIMRNAVEILRDTPLTELIWASPREILNVFQADEVGCHIITVTNEILKKIPFLGYDLERFSLETVKMFHRDAATAGFSL